MFAHDKKTSVRPAVQGKPNRTGLPDRLKSGVESMSGVSLDSIRVHYNSPEPARLQARAYARGTDIHIASGQEQHLPHEAWHAAQQLQGRVPPTARNMGAAVNDDPALEREADIMGRKAAQYQGGARSGISPGAAGRAFPSVAQLAKYGPLNPNEDYFSADDFGSYFPNIGSIKESSWNILKRICFSRLCEERLRSPGAKEIRTSTIGLDPVVKDIAEKIAADFPRLENLFKLYRELARVKFAGASSRQGGEASQGAAQARSAAPRNQWRLPDESRTESAETFLERYQDMFGGAGLVARYKSAIAHEINSIAYTGGSEAPLYHYDNAYHLSPRSAQTPDQDAGKNAVLYRAMKPEEYTYLKEYIDHFKSRVDARYDESTDHNMPAMVRAINALYNEFTRSFRGSTGIILPIGAHLGDFEQVISGYLNRAGGDERVVVKFVMRKQGEGKLGSFIQHLEQPAGGGEGPPQIVEGNHTEDRIGAKLERNGKFSLNVGTNKWASFMFLYFVDKIEVLNPGAIKEGGAAQ